MSTITLHYIAFSDLVLCASRNHWGRIRPRHLYQGVYSFCLSVRPFVCFGRSYSSVTFVKLTTHKGSVKVSGLKTIIHISIKPTQDKESEVWSHAVDANNNSEKKFVKWCISRRAFLFGSQLPCWVGIRRITPDPRLLVLSGAGWLASKA